MPGGRPPKLNQVLRHDDDGQPVTVGQHIVERVREVWLPWETIACGAGITTETLRQWTKWGGLARLKTERGEELTENEVLYREFLGELEKAESDAVQLRFGAIGREGYGGYEVSKTVVKAVAGIVTEVTTTTETVRPVWQALAWQLERRRPAEFGRRVAVEVAPIAIADRSEELASKLEAYLAGVADAAIPVHNNGSGGSETP